MDFLPELNQCFPFAHMLQYWPTASHCERVLKGFTLHFLVTFWDTFCFLWQSNSNPDHPWLSPLSKLSTWAVHLFCVTALFLVLKIQRPLSGRSSSIFILASQSTTCFLVLFAVCQPDCFSSHVLLLRVCVPCWWLRWNQSNSMRWQVEHNLTCVSRCVPVSRMHVWTNRLVSMRWCSYVYVHLGERGCDAHWGWPVAPALLESN